MLAFWGNNEALTAAHCTNPSEQLRYSNRAVNDSNITVTKPLSLWYSSQKFEKADN